MYRRAFSVLLLAGALGCSRQPQEYLIGAAGPQTLAYGIQNQHGIDLAVAEINHAGGINGVPLRVLTRDDRAEGAQATRVAAEFADNPRVIAVIGHAGSGAEVSAAHVYNAGRLPAVATTASSPDLTGISPWVFRMISSDSVNGVALARFASSLSDSLGRPVRVGVLYHNDAYGRGLTDAFLRSFHGDVINTDPLGSDRSVEPYIAYYRVQKPDLVFVASDEDLGIQLLKEAHRQQLETRFLGGDGWQGVVADPAAEGAYVGTPFTAQSADTAARRFVAAYRARYGELPNAQAALAYDATRIVARAIGAAGASRDGVRKYLSGLSRTNPFPSVSGPMWFASTNDPVGATFRITRVHDRVMHPVSGE